MDNYDKILLTMLRCKNEELLAAEKSDRYMRATYNPFKRFSLWRTKKMFMNHVVGIELAIHNVRKTIKSFDDK